MIRGAKRPGLCRLGSPGPNAVETEGLEKGLAARAAGAEYVIVTGGASNLGKSPLPPVVQSVVIARDADPAGSPSDQALWRGAVLPSWARTQSRSHRATERHCAEGCAAAQGSRRRLALRPRTTWRTCLQGANLEHGRLGEAVENAILELASRLDVVALGRAKKRIASLLGINLGELDDELSVRIKARVEKREEVKGCRNLSPGATRSPTSAPYSTTTSPCSRNPGRVGHAP